MRIQPAIFDVAIAHLTAARPNEGVGLIAAVVDGPHYRAAAFYGGTNIDQSPTRYTMDPAEVVAAIREMDANGWVLGAIVHSHPQSAPTPSATDLREAYYPDVLMLIVSFATGAAQARLWRTVPGRNGPEAREARLMIELD